jgi:hypothetical protein
MIEFDEVVGLSNEDGEQMALHSVSAKGKVNGLLLEMTIRQHYKNTTNKTLETTYTFPMGWGATFLDLHVEIGGKRLTGVVTEKQNERNQSVYAEILRYVFRQRPKTRVIMLCVNSNHLLPTIFHAFVF